MRVISRITDSVNVLARFALAARVETFWVLVIAVIGGKRSST
jgi:hypothetical protein